MGLIAAFAVGGAVLGAASYLQRFWSRFDPASPRAHDGDVARTLQVFAEAETARTLYGPTGMEPLHGLDQVVASDAIRKIPASVRMDFARTHPSDPDKLRAYLGTLQTHAIEKARLDPASVDYGTPWRVALTQLNRGSFLEGIGLLGESLKRNLDTALSRQVGINDSFGRNFARSIGLEEGEPLFAPISGTLDTAAVILGDPTLILGKAAKTTRLATVEGRVPIRGIERVLGIAAPHRVLETESGKLLDTADWAVRMPGVQNWAKVMAKESDAGQVLYWERIGGGIIDDVATRKAIAAADDPERITQLLEMGLRTGTVQRLPVYSSGRLRNKASLLARAQYINYGKRVWSDTLDSNDPAFEDDVLTLHRHLFGDEAATTRSQEWLTRFATADTNRVAVAEAMVSDGLKVRARDITSPHALRLARRAGVSVSGRGGPGEVWDELADAVSEGGREQLLARADSLGLSFAPDASDATIATALSEHVAAIPEGLSRDAWDNIKRYTGGYATEKDAAAFGYVPGRVLDQPILATQLQQHARVPSFHNLWNYELELASLASKRRVATKGTAWITRNLDEKLSGWRGLVLATPRTFLRNLSDDTLGALGHPEWGGLMLRRMAWGAWDFVAGSGFPGRRALRHVSGGLGKGRLRRSVEEASLAIPDRDLAAFADETGKVADALQTPARIRQATTWDRVVGLGGSLNDDLAERLTGRSLVDADWNVWRPVHRDDTAFPEAWAHFVNHQVLQDDAVKHIMAGADDPARRRALLGEYLGSEQGRVQRGLVRGVGTDEEFIALKADLIEYSIPKELAEYAKQGYIPPEKLMAFWKKNRDEVPEFVTGPSSLFNSTATDLPRSFSGTVRRTVDWAFGVGGAAADMLGRNPAYRTAFKYNHDVLTARAAKLADDGIEVAEDEILLRARRAAERQVLSQVDNFADRTRIGVLSRGLVPFLDAHLRFWKRWGKIAAKNPEHLERIRLLFGAGESMGWIEPNENGNLVFTVPIAPRVAAALLPGDEDLYKSWFSFTVGRQSEVVAKDGLEGLATLGENLGKTITPRGLPFSIEVIPGLSPVVSFPVDYLTLDMPGVREVAENILGPAPRYDPAKGGVFDAVTKSFFPYWLRGVFDVFEDEGVDGAKGQAVADALRYELHRYAAEHDGQIPTTKAQADEVMARARTTARHALVGRVLARLFSPFSQSALPYNREIAEDWHHMRASLGPEEGFAAFMDKHGTGATLYAIPQSKTEPGQAAINYSPEAERFYLDNPEFFRDFGSVGGFFTRDMPGFEYNVYRRFRRRGERSWVPPADLLAEAFYRLGNEDYYEKVRPTYDRALAQVSTKQGRDILSLWLASQRALIAQRYPGWEAAHAAAASNAQMREVAIADLRRAVEHPAVADMKATAATRRFLTLYDQSVAVAEQMGYKTITGRSFAPLRLWLSGQAKAIAASSGSEGFRSVYEFLFRPVLERDEDAVSVSEVAA